MKEYLLLLVVSPLLILMLHSVLFVILRFLGRAQVAPYFVTLIAESLAGIFLFLVVSSGPLAHWSEGERFWALAYGVVTYAAIAFSYFILFAMTEAARRIHIMRLIYAKPQMRSTLLDQYSPDQMLTIRLERMMALGQLVRSQGRYRLGRPQMYWMARIVTGWAMLLGLTEESS